MLPLFTFVFIYLMVCPLGVVGGVVWLGIVHWWLTFREEQWSRQAFSRAAALYFLVFNVGVLSFYIHLHLDYHEVVVLHSPDITRRLLIEVRPVFPIDEWLDPRSQMRATVFDMATQDVLQRRSLQIMEASDAWNHEVEWNRAAVTLVFKRGDSLQLAW